MSGDNKNDSNAKCSTLNVPKLERAFLLEKECLHKYGQRFKNTIKSQLM